ncbi:hypothetical protein KM043_011013 [Ampulex compressa]|nr:hypothetical protein KM043_011013 [Ampulex compressa]
MHKTLVFAKHSYRNSRFFAERMTDVIQNKPIELTIRRKLEDSLRPSHIDVINESYMHNVPKGAETHFKVVVVSEKFNETPLIKRHQMIHSILEAEFQRGVHALSIVAKTPDQWEQGNKTVLPSPACRGGFGK